MILGTYKREYPRGYVMRGWDPQNPTTLSSALPVVKDTAGMPDEIQPGMIISTNAEGNAWIHTTSVVFWAEHYAKDLGLSMAADSLVGLLCSGKFRFATPFFARYTKATSTSATTGTAAVYKAGTPLTYCADTEKENDSRRCPTSSQAQIYR